MKNEKCFKIIQAKAETIITCLLNIKRNILHDIKYLKCMRSIFRKSKHQHSNDKFLLYIKNDQMILKFEKITMNVFIYLTIVVVAILYISHLSTRRRSFKNYVFMVLHKMATLVFTTSDPTVCFFFFIHQA